MNNTQTVDITKLSDAEAGVKEALETIQEQIDTIGAAEGIVGGEQIAAELAAAKQSLERGLTRLSNVTSAASGQNSSAPDPKSTSEEVAQ